MSKRHESLIPLTHDHHHALAEARRLQLAAGRDTPDRVAAANTFLEFFGSETVGHFREEEEDIFPLVIDAAEAKDPLIRLLLDHVQMHGLVGRLQAELAGEGASADTMLAIASGLQEHIRYEEKVFFPLVESLAPVPLNSIELAPRARATVSSK
jgi:iron-sulfur cluster repair protein YtfE (RIC family)